MQNVPLMQLEQRLRNLSYKAPDGAFVKALSFFLLGLYLLLQVSQLAKLHDYGNLLFSLVDVSALNAYLSMYFMMNGLFSSL